MLESLMQLDLPEVYFLVLHWLSHGPCKHAAEALLQDVTQQGLLPQQYDVNGEQPYMTHLQNLRQHVLHRPINMSYSAPRNPMHHAPLGVHVPAACIPAEPDTLNLAHLHRSAAGGSRPSSYQSLLQEHSKVPADGLLQLLQQCLSRVQAADHAGAQVLLPLHIHSGCHQPKCIATGSHRAPRSSRVVMFVQQ